MAETTSDVRHITVDNDTRTELLQAADGFVKMNSTLRKKVADLYMKWRKLNWDVSATGSDPVLGKGALNPAASQREFFHDLDPEFPLDATQLFASAKKLGIPTSRQVKDSAGKITTVEDTKNGEIPMKTNNVQRYYPRYYFFAWIVRQKTTRDAVTPEERKNAEKTIIQTVARCTRPHGLSEREIRLLVIALKGLKPNKDGEYPSADKFVKAVMEYKIRSAKAPKPEEKAA